MFYNLFCLQYSTKNLKEQQREIFRVDILIINTALSKSVFRIYKRYIIITKYKTFSVLIYSYTNTSGNSKNEKLCENTMAAGQSVFTKF